MKKLTLFSLLLPFLMACSPKLEIRGTADSALNLEGKTVTLYVETDTAEFDVTYTSTISNNAFAFHQPLPKPQVATMRIEDYGDVHVVLEAGKIVCHLSQTDDSQGNLQHHFVCNGTANNDLLTAFQEENNRLTSLYEATTDSTEKASLETLYIDFVSEFILEHINTLVSNYLFTQSYWLFDSEQCEQILSRLTDESMSYGTIPRIYESWTATKATSAGCPYIDFSLPTTNGDTLSLSSIVGNTPYILVDFWASWCGPCRASMPQMCDLYARYADVLQILGVSLDADAAAWQNAIDKFGLKWLHVNNLRGWRSEPVVRYGVNAIPATVLIDNQGIIVGRNLSFQELETILSATK
ncbi:MAG: AhpC/TSA family protein [Paludibacter sp.]|nr:AhpC/TSA family protein [Bacteroidales bacterium]MCM1069506.1 AhpC/TSA family protein [Prevotella sp.]MCM1354162.1 AhpC/TSA family protein [Bacteroides sp.]MCM1442981.1 AhpC/TSA family protein [Muribaculum sp.]MCM1482237.1 AhpC/TSA family protein [Paludibacter sp.]